MDDPVVEVTAVGQAWATPDQVLVHLAVQGRAPAVADALRQASAAVQRLTEVLDELGVAEADRRTAGLNVEPVYDHTVNREAGHGAYYQLSVVVRDLELAGRLVERAAEQVGDALRVRQFALAVRDLLPHQELARTRAVQACRSQAEQVAAAAGMRLRDLVSLRTGGPGVPHFQSLSLDLAGGGMPVQAGEHEVTVVVTGTWRLSPHDNTADGEGLVDGVSAS